MEVENVEAVRHRANRASRGDLRGGLLCGVLACLSWGGCAGVPSNAVVVQEPLEGCTGELERVNLLKGPGTRRRSLEAVAGRHLVAVAVPPGPCGAERFEVLELCQVRGAYAYLPRSPGEAPKMVGVEDGFVAGALVGPPRAMRSRDLEGAGCERATHFVRAIELGATEPSPLEPPEPPSERKATFPGSCREGVWMPIPGCRTPLAAELVALAEPSRAMPEMVRIEAGPSKESAAVPGLSRREEALFAFDLDRTEVTVAAYRGCVEAGGCLPPAAARPEAPDAHRHCTYGAPGRDDHPVNCVTWHDAERFCRFRGKRLPTEEEWATAARVDDERPYVWGGTWPPPPGAGSFADEVGHDRFPHWEHLPGYVDGFAETAPVDAYEQDLAASGVLGLGGNVREWVADLTDAVPPRAARSGGRGGWRVVRGASFGEAREVDLRVTRRGIYSPGVRSAHVGFRCARSASAEDPMGRPAAPARVQSLDARMLPRRRERDRVEPENSREASTPRAPRQERGHGG